MVPMADNYNHSNVNVVQEIIHKRIHLEADESSKYFTKTKYMNDYSFIFQEELKQFDSSSEQSEFNYNSKLNIKGRFIEQNYEANQ